jgi:arylsulfatase A-like enzyme
LNDQPISLRARLPGLAIVAVAIAAVDTLLTRFEQDHRPLDPWSYVQAVVAWLVVAIIALAPTLITDAWLRKRGKIDGSRARAAVRLGAWTAMPIVLHAQINPYTELGGNTTGLETFAPWRDALIALVAMCAAVWIAGRLVRYVDVRKLAWTVALASIGAGFTVSFHSAPPPNAVQADPAKPNVLLLVWDTTRAQSLELYGYDRETTPNLAKLATDSLLFTDARSVATYTLTSHVSLLTGVYPSHHGARMSRQVFSPKNTPTVADDFRRAGYRTGAFVGTDVLHAQTGVATSFDVFDDQVDPSICYTHLWALVHDVQAVLALSLGIHRGNGSPHWFQDFQRPANEVLTDASNWVHDGDPRPWFCLINVYDAHWPYLPEQAERERWVRPYMGPIDGYSLRADDAPAKRDMTASDNQHLSDLYDAELAQLDSEVDRFLGGLDLAKTAIVMTSDHGEAFGEDGQYDHGNILECQVRVPLIVRPAGGTVHAAIDTPTSGVDVAPTLLALAGLPHAKAPYGRNLLGDLSQPRPLIVEDRDHYDPFNVQIVSYEGQWKLVRYGLGARKAIKLYDLSQDPLGLKNVELEHSDVAQRMDRELDAFRKTWNVDDEKDATTRGPMNTQALRGLGYVGGIDPLTEEDPPAGQSTGNSAAPGSKGVAKKPQ